MFFIGRVMFGERLLDSSKITYAVVHSTWTRKVMDQKYLMIDLRQVDSGYNQLKEQTIAVVMNGRILIGKGKMRICCGSTMILAYANMSLQSLSIWILLLGWNLNLGYCLEGIN
jgi:hypothetical protein